MSSDNVQALSPGTRLGDYRLDATIGHGGFGITYRALDTQLTKFVAIKEYLPIAFAIRQGDGQVVARGARLAEDFAWGRERFLDEARALARFRHPHIVPVLRYFEANGTAYTVMEFEDGRSLGELLREPGTRLPVDDVRRLADGLLSGLGAIHAQGFLHRDIKPSNIIIRRDGVPVLIDFGAARQAVAGHTRSLTSVLTPQYAPIEQYSLDGRQGPWSDIYSAAAVLYHAIAGEPPPDAAARVGSDPYWPLSERQADRFDATFLSAIDRALAFAPADRPQHVEEWVALFGASLPHVDDAPTQRLADATNLNLVTPRLGGVSREPDDTPAPPRRSSRAGLAVVIVLIAVAGATLWQFAPQLRALFVASAPPNQTAPPAQTANEPVAPPAAPPAAPMARPPTGQPAPAQATVPPPAAAPQPIVEEARRAAFAAAIVLERAEDTARAARAMAGEARIVAANAGRPDLERAERLSYDGGASYIGQVSDKKRQGLGVAELANGERQAGDWDADKLNGLGTAKFADDTRYAGQWNSGQATGLGVRDKPGVERCEGTFVDARFDGLGVRRTLVAPIVIQTGEFRAGRLEGPGVETVGEGERYEGMFRAGKRNGFGERTGPDGKVTAGRWEEGKLVESAP